MKDKIIQKGKIVIETGLAETVHFVNFNSDDFSGFQEYPAMSVFCLNGSDTLESMKENVIILCCEQMPKPIKNGKVEYKTEVNLRQVVMKNLIRKVIHNILEGEAWELEDEITYEYEENFTDNNLNMVKAEFVLSAQTDPFENCCN